MELKGLDREKVNVLNECLALCHDVSKGLLTSEQFTKGLLKAGENLSEHDFQVVMLTMEKIVISITGKGEL